MFSQNDRQNSHNDGEKPPAPARRDDGGHQTSTTAVWLLDDDPSVLKATERLLRASGCDVRTFTDPCCFLQYAQVQPPCVAVLDVLMPAMNGLQVQTRLREIAPATRVIMLTSNDDPIVRETAMKAGAAGFFLKPADDEQFLSGIQAALDGQRNGANPRAL